MSLRSGVSLLRVSFSHLGAQEAPLRNLLKLFVLSTLQFFTFTQSKFISNIIFKKKLTFYSNAEWFESTGFDIPLYASPITTFLSRLSGISSLRPQSSWHRVHRWPLLANNNQPWKNCPTVHQTLGIKIALAYYRRQNLSFRYGITILITSLPAATGRHPAAHQPLILFKFF